MAKEKSKLETSKPVKQRISIPPVRIVNESKDKPNQFKKTRGSYYAIHNANVENTVDISKSKIKIGMICRIDYRAEDRKEKKTSLYLIISLFGNKLHCIDLDYVSSSELKSMLSICEGRKTAMVKIGNWEGYYFPFLVAGTELYQRLVSIIGNQAYRVLSPFKIRYLKFCIMDNMREYSKETKTNKKDSDNKDDDNDDKNKSDKSKDKNKDNK